MKLWQRWRGRDEAKATSLDLLRHLIAGGQSNSGASVTQATALQVATVLACVREIAEAPAALPLRINRVADDGSSRRHDTAHPVSRLLRRPNPWQTSQQFIETLTGHAALAGAGR
ncbi:phage portal protein, partial [Modestobacter versicolor]